MNKKIPADIISGFLGSGKTTLINELLAGQYSGLDIAVIENEFGQVDVDSALLPEDIEITKITGGCVCCTLKVSLIEGIRLLFERFSPDRIVIETTGVAKLSDVISAVRSDTLSGIVLPALAVAVVNPVFHSRFSGSLGSFYSDQIKSAGTVYITREGITDKKTLEETINSIKQMNKSCRIVTQPSQIDINDVLPGSGEEVHAGGHHEHDDTARRFESVLIQTPQFADEKELAVFIDNIISDASPKSVYRIKGTVTAGGRSVLVQWAGGQLELSGTASSDNTVVAVKQA